MKPIRIQQIFRRSMPVFTIFVIALFYLFHSLMPKYAHSSAHSNHAERHHQACVQPQFPLYPPEFKNMFKRLPPLKCHLKQADWVLIRNGTFIISPSVIEKHGNVTCNAKPILRGKNDAEMIQGQRHPIKHFSPMKNDFSEFFCTSEKSNQTYKNLHLGMAPKPDVLNRPIRLAKNSIGSNVLMLVLDSVSRLVWMRQLPLTYRYLADELGAVLLNGVNIVGEGTQYAMLPILTGHQDFELPEARKGHADAKPVDRFPWIWKEFKNMGYVTMFGEDLPDTFSWYLKGFEKQPTDHYMRHFYIKMKDFINHSQHCLGSQSTFSLTLKYIQDMYDAYPKRPKFSLSISGQYSHDDNVPVSKVDWLLRDWLASMNDAGHFNNTFLIVMSDHGARFSNVREFVQGKFEERNPFLSIRPPPWFIKKYPDTIRNLRANVNRLVTPYDYHAFFQDLLHFDYGAKADVSKRSVSFLREIPHNRTCQMAGIAQHWCSCLNWQNISTKDARVIKAVDTFIETINNMTQPFRALCEHLKVVKIVRSVMLQPNEQLLKFKKAIEIDKRSVDDLTDNTKNDVELYQLTLHTEPGGGKFEATVQHFIRRKLFSTNSREIGRTSKYGNDPWCIRDNHPHLVKYCYCKKPFKG